MSQVPFYLVTGFLGSGKTTFLKQVLNKYAFKKKIAIIQNEFAPANIDGIVLKKDGQKFKILEINNGSVFCVCLLSSFISSLKEFVTEHKPDLIFLEASGLSDPIAIAQLLDFKDLKNELYLAKVWTIVDSAHFLRQQKLITRLQHQIRVADVVIVNKVDLSSREQLEEVEKAITSLNPFAKILRSSFCKVSDQELVVENIHDSIANQTQKLNAQFESCGRPKIGVGVLRSTQSISKDKLDQFIDFYVQKTIRIKGFVKLADGGGMAVQTSYTQKEFREVENFQGSTELIAMGEEFDFSEFSRNYREIVK